jgi:hypothetical protein
MINLANELEDGSFGLKLVDHIVGIELDTAGVRMVETEKRSGEPRTKIYGELAGWKFERAWYYWYAHSIDRPMPVGIASDMHDMEMPDGRNYGSVIRVNGDCTCPHPSEENAWFVGSKCVLSLSDKLEYESLISRGLDSMMKYMDEYLFSDDPASIGAIKCVNRCHIDSQDGLNLFAKTLLTVW